MLPTPDPRKPHSQTGEDPDFLIPDPPHPSDFYMDPTLRLATKRRAMENERGLKKGAC